MSGMEKCDELRRKVMAYIGEHYEPERDADASPVWDAAIDHALGKRPKSIDEAERHTWYSAVATELADIFATRNSGNEDAEPFSPARMVWTAFSMTGETWGLELDKGKPPDPPLTELERYQLLYDWAEIWLINVRDGAMDATCAFVEEEDDEEEAS